MAISTKLIDKINSVLTSEKDQNKTFYSFEYFPPRTEQGNIKKPRVELNYVYRCWELTRQNWKNGHDKPSLGRCHMV